MKTSDILGWNNSVNYKWTFLMVHLEHKGWASKRKFMFISVESEILELFNEQLKVYVQYSDNRIKQEPELVQKVLEFKPMNG